MMYGRGCIMVENVIVVCLEGQMCLFQRDAFPWLVETFMRMV